MEMPQDGSALYRSIARILYGDEERWQAVHSCVLGHLQQSSQRNSEAHRRLLWARQQIIAKTVPEFRGSACCYRTFSQQVQDLGHWQKVVTDVHGNPLRSAAFWPGLEVVDQLEATLPNLSVSVFSPEQDEVPSTRAGRRSIRHCNLLVEANARGDLVCFCPLVQLPASPRRRLEMRTLSEARCAEVLRWIEDAEKHQQCVALLGMLHPTTLFWELTVGQ